jgi:hypothetical protein
MTRMKKDGADTFWFFICVIRYIRAIRGKKQKPFVFIR